MSIVCTICQDLVTEKPQQLPETEELEIRAMTCGHVFHRSCIKEWFEKAGSQFECGPCPCCKKPVAIQDGLKIFPSGDEESQAIAEKIHHVKAQTEEIQNMHGEMDQLSTILEEVGCQLENEKVEHTILKYEHGQRLLEIAELKKQAEENAKLMAVEETNWKELVENITNERDNAVEKLKETEDRLTDDKKEYLAKINELEKKLGIELAAKDVDMLRKRMQIMEQTHLNEVHNYEQRLGRMSQKSHKACQTDGRDAALLQARLVSYKSCLLHMESEVRFLEDEYGKLSLQQPMENGFSQFMDSLPSGGTNKTCDTSDESINQSREINDGDQEEDVMCIDMGDSSEFKTAKKNTENDHETSENGIADTNILDNSFWISD